MGLFGSVCLFKMQLGLLFISQLQQLHSMPWLRLNLFFKSHENRSYYLLSASIVVFLLDNLGTCIMCAFYLPDVICVASQKSNTCCSLIDPRASLWLALGPCHLLCLRVTIWLVYNPLTTQIHALLFYCSCVPFCLAYILTIV